MLLKDTPAVNPTLFVYYDFFVNKFDILTNKQT